MTLTVLLLRVIRCIITKIKYVKKLTRSLCQWVDFKLKTVNVYEELV